MSQTTGKTRKLSSAAVLVIICVIPLVALSYLFIPSVPVSHPIANTLITTSSRSYGSYVTLLEVSCSDDTIAAPIGVATGILTVAIIGTFGCAQVHGPKTTFTNQYLVTGTLTATYPFTSTSYSTLVLSPIDLYQSGSIIAITLVIVIVITILLMIRFRRDQISKRNTIARETEEPDWKFCRGCAAKIPRNSKFCKECGTKLVE
ncbi:MAG: zinc ribbon domain-containing protein [Candidatus Bathyarchaeia archaeon]